MSNPARPPLDGVRRIGRIPPPRQPDPQAEIVDDAARQQADQIGVSGQSCVDAVEGVRRHRGPADMVEAFQHLHALPCPGQVCRGHQTVVPAADDDDVSARHLMHHVAGRYLTDVALDLARGPHLCVRRIAAALSQCPALPEQIPALVELHLDRLQAPVFLGFVDFVMLQLAAQLLLLGDEFVHLKEDVLVVGHASQCARIGRPASGR